MSYLKKCKVKSVIGIVQGLYWFSPCLRWIGLHWIPSGSLLVGLVLFTLDSFRVRSWGLGYLCWIPSGSLLVGLVLFTLDSFRVRLWGLFYFCWIPLGYCLCGWLGCLGGDV